jgi:DNA polymerase epsilon subunit 1
VRCGLWFDVKAIGGNIMLSRRTDLLTFAEVRICAFDIETSKEPLQFPNADQGDQVRSFVQRSCFTLDAQSPAGLDT